MCVFASFVLTKTGAYWSEKGDSHEDIILEHNLPEPDILRVELTPEEDLCNFDTWKYCVDQDQDVMPRWFNSTQDEHRTRTALRRRFPDWSGNAVSIKGDLNLISLTSLPAGTKLSAGGSLDLGRLTSLPADAKLSAGGNLYLCRLMGMVPTGVVVAGNVIR